MWYREHPDAQVYPYTGVDAGVGVHLDIGVYTGIRVYPDIAEYLEVGVYSGIGVHPDATVRGPMRWCTPISRHARISVYTTTLRSNLALARMPAATWCIG